MDHNRIKEKIAEAGFTQRSLANALGMGRNTLNLKINGRIPFNTKEVEEICEKLGIRDSREKVAIFLE